MNEQPAVLSVGGVVSNTFDIWLKNLVPFSVLALILYSPVILYALVAPVGGSTSNWLYTTITGFVPAALNLVISGAVAYGVFKQLQGENVALADCVRIGLQRFLAALGTGLLVFLAIVGGLLLFVIPGIIFSCIFYVAIVAAVVERTGPTDSMRRSAALTKGSRWKVFFILVVLGLIGFAVGWIITLIFPQPSAAEILSSTYRPPRIQTAVGLVLGAILGCLGAVAAVVVYYRLRSGKEQVDIGKIVAVFA